MKTIEILGYIVGLSFITAIVGLIIMYGVCPGMYEDAIAKEKECGVNCTKEQKNEIYKKFEDHFTVSKWMFIIGIIVFIPSIVYFVSLVNS